MIFTLSRLENDGRTMEGVGIDVRSIGSLNLDLKVEVRSAVQAKTQFPHSVRDVKPGL